MSQKYGVKKMGENRVHLHDPMFLNEIFGQEKKNWFPFS